MFKRKIVFTILLLITLNFVPGTTMAEETHEELIWATPFDLDIFNCFPCDDYIYELITSATHAKLITRNDLTGDFEPSLALEEPVISFEGNNTIIDVSLRPDLKFYNGKTLSAEDVVFSYKMALTRKVNHPEYFNLVNYFDSNDSVVEISDLKIRFIMNQKYSLFKNLLTLPIKSKAYHEPVYMAEAFPFVYENIQECNSAGPFMVSSYMNETLTLVRNPYWFGSTPLLDKIIFKKIDNVEEAFLELKQGKIDVMPSVYYYYGGTSEAMENASYHLVEDTSTQEISLNHDNPYLNGSATPLGLTDTERAVEAGKFIRKAISHLVDRASIVNELLEGKAQALSTIFPSGSYGWSEDFDVREFNHSISKEYLKLAGYNFSTDVNLSEPINENNSLFTVYLMSPSTCPSRNHWLPMLEYELPKVGIYVGCHMATSWSVIIPLTFGSETRPPIGALNETSEYLQMSGWDLFSVGYSHGIDWNPDGLLDSASIRPNGDNIYNFENDEWDALLKSYLEKFNLEKRLNISYQMQEFLYEYEPIIPLFTPMSVWGVSNNVQGLDLFLLPYGFQDWSKVTGRTVIEPSDKSDNSDKIAFQNLSFAIITLSLMMIRRKRAIK
jgi:peptide/nickel transport system substrate-binding protein